MGPTTAIVGIAGCCLYRCLCCLCWAATEDLLVGIHSHCCRTEYGVPGVVPCLDDEGRITLEVRYRMLDEHDTHHLSPAKLPPHRSLRPPHLILYYRAMPSLLCMLKTYVVDLEILLLPTANFQCYSRPP
ncbi:hypothetical protein EV127DRAFT_255811 [Xylaria flabelliformis]|nr:hypothetical protein EV127DRAFT_255811 [Xylaria flabelliformis]